MPLQISTEILLRFSPCAQVCGYFFFLRNVGFSVTIIYPIKVKKTKCCFKTNLLPQQSLMS